MLLTPSARVYIFAEVIAMRISTIHRSQEYPPIQAFACSGGTRGTWDFKWMP